MSSLFVQASNNKSRYQRDQPAIISNPVINMNKLVGLREPKNVKIAFTTVSRQLLHKFGQKFTHQAVSELGQKISL